jgi:hypothetical protein
MAILKSKGTVFAISITAVYTAIPNLQGINLSGEMTEVFDTTVLSGSAYKTKAPSGYTNTTTITAEGFYDPDDTTIVAFEALLATPVATNFKVTYTDTTPTEDIYSGVAFGLDKTISPADGIKCSYTVETSGAPS